MESTTNNRCSKYSPNNHETDVSNESDTSSDSPSESAIKLSSNPLIPQPCSNCGSVPSTYRCFPCGCALFCKKCAMKLATGGRCRVCHKLFVSMKNISA